MKKQFVPFKLSLKLRELGYNEPSLFCWDTVNKPPTLSNCPHLLRNSQLEGFENKPISAPLWQQAFDWMSTKFGMHGNVFPTGDNGEYQTFEYTKGYGGTSSNGKTYSNIYKCRTELLKSLIKYKS